jgi:hypothetical protein
MRHIAAQQYVAPSRIVLPNVHLVSRQGIDSQRTPVLSTYYFTHPYFDGLRTDMRARAEEQRAAI